MAKNDVQSWDTTAGNNTDIAGVNLAEGCAAAGINDAIRTVMSQIATWLAAASGPLLKTGGAVTGAITGMLTGSTVQDGAGTPRYVGYRNIPLTAKTANYTLALIDVGQGLSTTTGGWTLPLNATVAFAIGDTVALYNNSASSQTITATGGVTLRLAGSATTGNRTVAQRGLCTLVKVATDEWVASGTGVS
jgi:hypothetical protein